MTSDHLYDIINILLLHSNAEVIIKDLLMDLLKTIFDFNQEINIHEATKRKEYYNSFLSYMETKLNEIKKIN